ncbi:uncharacterized protein LOC124259780 [Haliotis rubra]|uniref:uncharacterized protein LOC124259780 n=1 Tax=Haliotis rubra TaxID=36100 RepID=UPI001EE4FF5A|nr:uncharacterized protein LOC124259780 [Haliotis rubra]
MWRGSAGNWGIPKKNKGMKVKDSTAASGSVLATLVLEGSNAGVSQAMDEMCKDVENGVKYSFGGQSVSLMPYMMVDGKMAYGVSCGPTNADKGLSPGIIAAIVLGHPTLRHHPRHIPSSGSSSSCPRQRPTDFV